MGFDVPEIRGRSRSRVLDQLRSRYPESSQQEIESWRRNVPELQREVSEVVQVRTDAADFTAVMEYELPMESRRADAVLLVGAAVVVLELKGKISPSDADIDQAHAYARDLSCYHRDCHSRPVHAVLVPTRMAGRARNERGVTICPPKLLDELVAELSDAASPDPLRADRFLEADAYRPMPLLVRAARDLFRHQRPPQLWRSARQHRRGGRIRAEDRSRGISDRNPAAYPGPRMRPDRAKRWSAFDWRIRRGRANT